MHALNLLEWTGFEHITTRVTLGLQIWVVKYVYGSVGKITWDANGRKSQILDTNNLNIRE